MTKNKPTKFDVQHLIIAPNNEIAANHKIWVYEEVKGEPDTTWASV